MNYIDRNALPQAKVQGLVADIGLVGVEYNIVLSLTFIGYILMQGMNSSHAGIVKSVADTGESAQQHDPGLDEA